MWPHRFEDADASPSDGADAVLALLAAVASRECVPRANAHGNTHFQLDRGVLGVSLCISRSELAIHT